MIDYQFNCPYCQGSLQNQQLLWQGMFVCVNSYCQQCNKDIIQDLKIAHGNRFNYQLDLDSNKIFGDPTAESWLGKPLLKSLKSPQNDSIQISKEIFQDCERVIILNCLDVLYGHCLLKLLNAERHLLENKEYGLIVIIPRFLRWLVPDGVAEIWTMDLSIKKAQLYYPEFNRFIQNEIQRFSQVFVSRAYSHPSKFQITNFTRVARHDFSNVSFRVTFIWREDRLWSNSFISPIGLWQQNRKVSQVFSQIRKHFPNAIFTIVGLGKSTPFPHWIEDARVVQFNSDNEENICEIYRESRLILGIHGSNMLLPSAHAGMTINILPKDRLGNFAQDILYQETDPRIAAFCYRYISFKTPVQEVSILARSMLDKFPGFFAEMTADISP